MMWMEVMVWWWLLWMAGWTHTRLTSHSRLCSRLGMWATSERREVSIPGPGQGCLMKTQILVRLRP